MFSKPSQLLVCETDGFALQGAVISRKGTEITALYSAFVSEGPVLGQVEMLVAALKEQGWQGTGQVALLLPTALSTLIELPVNPKKPRTVEQMSSLASWEAEPLLMQHVGQWTEADLWLRRGWLTEIQADAVLDAQQDATAAIGRNQFADVAKDLGYVTTAQVAAMAGAMEALKADLASVSCGWLAQGEVVDVPGSFNWLVSCVDSEVMARWTTAFSKQGLQLRSVYPALASAINLFPDEDGVALSASAGGVLAANIEAGKIVQQQYHPVGEGDKVAACLAGYQSLSPSVSLPVYVSSDAVSTPILMNDLGEMLSVKLHALKHVAISDMVSPPMVGAAKYALGLKGTQYLADIRVDGPDLPLMQRGIMRFAMLLVMLLLAIMAAEGFLWWQGKQVIAERSVVEEKWNVVDGATQRIKGDIAQIDARKAMLEQQQKNQQQSQLGIEFFGSALPDRARLIQVLLGGLQNAVNDEVVIENIDEFGKRVPIHLPINAPKPKVELENINLEAWALSESAAQTFIQEMAEAMAPWGIEVRDSQVLSRVGPLNLAGFSVALRLVKPAPEGFDLNVVEVAK